jgi:hypothetical protein
MTSRDLVALIVSYLYAFGLLGLAEAIRKGRGYSQAFTRKLVQSDNDAIGLCPFHSTTACQTNHLRWTVVWSGW